MKVMKLFKNCGFVNCMVLKLPDGNYGLFYSTPARKIRETDIRPCPYYKEIGKRAEEAEPYMYQMYGLTKMKEEDDNVSEV